MILICLCLFTNFACWAPIAFFGLTASAGIPLIDITHSKILLVFFYPLNSFANPYLYVIITKQFRKDLYILLGKYGICTERANRYRVTLLWRNVEAEQFDSLFDSDLENTEGQIDDFDLLMSFLLEFWMLL
jgi:hypothetical protein